MTQASRACSHFPIAFSEESQKEFAPLTFSCNASESVGIGELSEAHTIGNRCVMPASIDQGA